MDQRILRYSRDIYEIVRGHSENNRYEWNKLGKKGKELKDLE